MLGTDGKLVEMPDGTTLQVPVVDVLPVGTLSEMVVLSTDGLLYVHNGARWGSVGGSSPIRFSTGGEGERFALFLGLRTVSEGEREFSLSSAVLVGTGYATAVSNVRNGGTVDWSNPTNAQGVANGTFSVVSASGPKVADATLRCRSFSLSAPPGFSRTKVEVVLTHSYDFNVTAPATANGTMFLRDARGVITAPFSESSGALTNPTPQTFDVTSSVSGISDLSSLDVWCTATAGITSILKGSMAWSVDAIYLRLTYTKTAIS